MDIASMLANSGALESAAREMGIDTQTAAAGAAVLLPAVLGGFKKQAQAAPGGLDGFGAILGQMGGGGLFDAVVGNQPTPVDQGNAILGQIFGSREVSREVAGNAAAQSGISADTLKRLLPVVAMLVAGYLARQGGGQAQPSGGGAGGMGGMLGQVLGSVLGGGRSATPTAGAGGLASMLDLDGDGNPLNDIIGMAGRLRS